MVYKDIKKDDKDKDDKENRKKKNQRSKFKMIMYTNEEIKKR